VRAPAAPQRGFTLIELLVALLIALFLLAGLVTLEQSMFRTFRAQGGLAELQDEERFALIMMGGVIQEAGYFPDPTTNTVTLALPVATPAAGAAFPSATQSIAGTYSAAAPGDTVSVRYMTAAHSTQINCTGGSNTTAGTVLYTNVFSVNAGNAAAGIPPSLQCTPNGGVTAPVTLINNVTNLQIWYGVKTNAAVSTNNIDSYLRANVMTNSNWLNVTSVMFTLTFTNPLAGQPGQPPTVKVTRIIAVMPRAGLNT
jgi:type IV pilus assembly protein PilW